MRACSHVRKRVVYHLRILIHTNRIRTDLSLLADSDFAILLAIAEKLKPGSYVTLAGDPTTIEEVLKKTKKRKGRVIMKRKKKEAKQTKHIHTHVITRYGDVIFTKKSVSISHRLKSRHLTVRILIVFFFPFPSLPFTAPPGDKHENRKFP